MRGTLWKSTFAIIKPSIAHGSSTWKDTNRSDASDTSFCSICARPLRSSSSKAVSKTWQTAASTSVQSRLGKSHHRKCFVCMNLIGVVMVALGKVILCPQLSLSLSLYYVTVNCFDVLLSGERSLLNAINAPFPIDWQGNSLIGRNILQPRVQMIWLQTFCPTWHDATTHVASAWHNANWRLPRKWPWVHQEAKLQCPKCHYQLPNPRLPWELVANLTDCMHIHSHSHGNLPRFWKHLSALAKIPGRAWPISAKGTVFTCLYSFTHRCLLHLAHKMSLKTSEVPPQDLQKDPVPTGLNAKECNQREIVLFCLGFYFFDICIWQRFSACWSMPISQQAAVSPSVAYLRFKRLGWIGHEHHSCYVF